MDGSLPKGPGALVEKWRRHLDGHLPAKTVSVTAEVDGYVSLVDVVDGAMEMVDPAFDNLRVIISDFGPVVELVDESGEALSRRSGYPARYVPPIGALLIVRDCDPVVFGDTLFRCFDDDGAAQRVKPEDVEPEKPWALFSATVAKEAERGEEVRLAGLCDFLSVELGTWTSGVRELEQFRQHADTTLAKYRMSLLRQRASSIADYAETIRLLARRNGLGAPAIWRVRREALDFRRSTEPSVEGCLPSLVEALDEAREIQIEMEGRLAERGERPATDLRGIMLQLLDSEIEEPPLTPPTPRSESPERPWVGGLFRLAPKKTPVSDVAAEEGSITPTQQAAVPSVSVTLDAVDVKILVFLDEKKSEFYGFRTIHKELDLKGSATTTRDRLFRLADPALGYVTQDEALAKNNRSSWGITSKGSDLVLARCSANTANTEPNDGVQTISNTGRPE